MPSTSLGRSSVSFYLLLAYALAIYGFLFAPIGIVVLMSFNSARYSSFPLEHFTWQWYADLLANASIWQSVQNSLLVALATTVLATTLGTLAAYALARYQFRLKTAFIALLLVPLIVPGIIMGVSLLSFYSFLGIPTSLITIILGHTALALPYAALVVAARLQGFDRRLEETAASLGAPYHRVFRRVTLPLLAPGIIAAGLFAWTISFDEFIITFFVTGIRQTLPIRIWSLLKFGLSPTINAISSIILIVALALIATALMLSGRNHTPERR
jgi:spermidine/putrescine transport system permease protein